MKDFKHYFEKAEKQYRFRIKTIAELNDLRMSKLEQVLLRYKPLDIGKVGRTILINNPVDFPNMTAEVYFLDVVLGLPVNAYILMQNIREALGLAENAIIVRSPNDPNEIQVQALAAIAELDAEAKKKGLVPAPLLNDPKYSEAVPVDSKTLYGTAHNKGLVNYLTTIQKARSAANTVPGHPGLFAWLDANPKSEDFNADMKVDRSAADLPVTAQGGNLTNDTTIYTRLYQNSKGEITELKTKKSTSGTK